MSTDIFPAGITSPGNNTWIWTDTLPTTLANLTAGTDLSCYFPAGEIEITLDEDGADLIEDGKIDLGQYAVEQLVLSLDPFPRKPGAAFVQPQEPNEISPFAALKALKDRDAQD